MTVLADTGALYALIDRDDAWHERVVRWWAARPRDVLVPVTVIPEVTYLLARRIGPRAEEAFVRALYDELPVEPLEPEDAARAADLMQTYRDAALGFVDGSIVAMAERLEVTDVLTTDRRHFALARARHVAALRLVP